MTALPAPRGARREELVVAAAEDLGAYTLLRLRGGDLDPGRPGQFFMLRPPGHVLPRPMSLCLPMTGELAFLIDPVGPATRALCELRRGDRVHVLGPLGNGFDLDVARPFLVGGGIGLAPLPFLSERLGSPPALLGFRTAEQAQAAILLRHAEVVLEPTLVTDALPDDPGDVLACGPEPMLRALAGRAPGAQLAWEAPMACGWGACYGCVVDVGGEARRLCLDGPVLRSAPAPWPAAGEAAAA